MTTKEPKLPYADLAVPYDALDLADKYARQAMLLERERCALIAATNAQFGRSDWGRGYDCACEDIAKKIRSFE